MIYPSDEICLAFSKIYCEQRVKVQYSSFAFKYTHYHQWTPYLLVGTRLHIFMCSFNQKDEKKQVRVYNLKEAQLTENTDSKLSKFENVANLQINQDEYVLRFIQRNDLRNWSLLVNRRLPPVLTIKNCGDVYEREGFCLNLCEKGSVYFSELCIGYDQFDKRQVTERSAFYINLGDFAKLFNVSHGLLLNQGNLVSKYEQKDADFYNAYYKQYVNIAQVYVEEDDDVGLNQETKQTYCQSDWNSVFLQKIKAIKDLFSKYYYFKEQQYYEGEDDRELEGKIDIDVPDFISSQLMYLLKTKKASTAMEQMMLETNQVQAPTESLTGAIANLCQFIGIFRARCSEIAKLMVDELYLPVSERRLLDVSVQADAEKLYYLQGKHQQLYANFLASVKTVDYNSLEDIMTRIGPVHGSIAMTQELGSSYGQLISQPPDFIVGTRLYSLPPPPGEAPEFCYDESNGYPKGQIDTTDDESAYVMGKPVYPNQLPPVSEVYVDNIRFKFAVDSENHTALNKRRDTLQASFRDDLVVNQASSEYHIIQTLFDNNQIGSANQLLSAPLSCIIDYCGFRIFCSAVMREENLVFGYQNSNGTQSQAEFSKESQLMMTNQQNAPDEQFEIIVKNTRDYLNIQPHLMLSHVKTALNLPKYSITNQFFNTSFVNFLSQRLNKYPYGGRLSKFIYTFKRDITMQLNYIYFDDIYNDLNDEILMEIDLSALIQVYNQSNGKYFAKNFSALSLPDLPSQFIKNVLPTLQNGENYTLLNKITQIAFQCRLPVKFTRILNEPYNPDVCLSGLRLKQLDLETLTVDLLEHFEQLDGKRVQTYMDKRKFSKFLLSYLNEFYYENSLQQCQRISDLYRTTYLPLLMKIIDNHISANQLHTFDVPKVLEYMQVPLYLWLYCANFSQYLECLEMVRLAVAAKAIVRYLNENLRRIRRGIQQFGIRNTSLYPDYQGNLQCPPYSLEASVVNYVDMTNPERMNFFTAQTSQERILFTDRMIKQYIVRFLNSCFAHGSEGKTFWTTIDRMIELYYYDHSFAQEYTFDVLAEQGGELQAGKFAYEHFDQQLLFRDALGLKSAFSQKEKEICLQKAYRLQLLDFFVEYSGIVLADRNNYDFLSSSAIFQLTDIISIEPNFTMPMDYFVNELCNVPYRPWIHTAIEIETYLTNQFSFRLHYTTKSTDIFYETKQRFIARIQPPDQHFYTLFKHFHYNISFMKFSNLYSYRSFEHLLCETAAGLSSSIYPRFGSLRQQYDYTLVRQYIEVKEVAKLFAATALTIVRRNSTTGASVYKSFIDVLATIEDFEAELRQHVPNTLLFIQREQQQNMSIFTEESKNVMQTSLEAFQLAMKAHVNVLSNHSLEVVKLRILFAIEQFKKAMFTQALEQLKFAEETVIYKAGAGCQILMEIYNFMGLVFDRQQKQSLSVEFYDKAFNVAWLWLTTKKQALEKLQQQKQALYARLQSLEQQKPTKPTALKFKFVQESDYYIYIKLQRHDQALEQNAAYLADVSHFSDPRGNVSVQNSGLDASMAFSATDQAKHDFPDYMTSAHEYESPERHVQFVKQALKIADSRIAATQAEFDLFNLFISQIYENHARTCEQLLRPDNRDDLKEYRACAFKAYEIRAATLGKTHFFTLYACVLMSRAELLLGRTEQGLKGLEFALKSMPAEPTDDLNPVPACQINRLHVFRLLIQTVLDSLPTQLADVAITAQKIATSRAAAPHEYLQRVVQEVCSRESIHRCVTQMVERAYNARSQSDVNDLVYLLQYLNDEDIIEIDGELDQDEAYGRVEVQSGTAEFGQEMQLNDDELY